MAIPKDLLALIVKATLEEISKLPSDTILTYYEQTDILQKVEKRFDVI